MVLDGVLIRLVSCALRGLVQPAEATMCIVLVQAEGTQVSSSDDRLALVHDLYLATCYYLASAS
jgi:hypothetical protein